MSKGYGENVGPSAVYPFNGDYSNYEPYEYEYSYGHDDYEEYLGTISFAQIMQIAMVVVIILRIMVAISFLVPSLRVPELRQDPGRWPQVLVVSLMLFLDLISLTLNIVATSMTLTSLCAILLPIDTGGAGVLELSCVVLILIERIVGVTRGDPARPGFTRVISGGLMLGITLFTIAFMVGVTYGVGAYSGKCHDAYDQSTTVFMASHSILQLVILGLSITLIVLLCRARVGREKPYPLGRVLPIIIASLQLVFLFITSFITGFTPVYLTSVLLMVLIWLVADPDVRCAYADTFCRCCRHRERDGERDVLLKNKP